MIRLVTGPLGTGKSYYGVKMAVEALRSGRMVATNFDMVDDWVDQVVRHGHIFKNTRKLDERVEAYKKRYVRIHTMEDLRKLRVRPAPPYAREVEPDKWVVREGMLVVILDEAHRWMNARSWSREGREHLLEYFALARKRGMTVYLIAQRSQNLDVQVRELFEDHISLKNLKRSMRAFGIPICPWNIFIAGWTNHAYPGECIRTDRYRLGWEKRLYDTMDTVSFHEGESEDSVTYLPLGDADAQLAQSPPAGVPPPATGVAGAAPPSDGGPAAPPPLWVPERSGDPAGEQIVPPDPAL